MLFLALASVATITGATTVGHEFPLGLGTYDMDGRNAVETSLAGMMMEVKHSQRMATLVNFTFEHDNGTRYYTDDVRLAKLLSITRVTSFAAPAFIGTCYYFDARYSSPGRITESLRKGVRPFTGLHRVRAKNLYVCPNSNNAVTVKILQRNGTYADFMLVRTVQGVGRMKSITPGRYLKADV